MRIVLFFIILKNSFSFFEIKKQYLTKQNCKIKLTSLNKKKSNFKRIILQKDLFGNVTMSELLPNSIVNHYVCIQQQQQQQQQQPKSFFQRSFFINTTHFTIYNHQKLSRIYAQLPLFYRNCLAIRS